MDNNLRVGSDFEQWHADRLANQQAPRGRDPVLENVQRQFPGAEIIAFPQRPRMVVASIANYTEEINIPSAARFMRITTNNGVYVAQSQIAFPVVKGAEYLYCPLNENYLCHGISTLNVGLLNIGDVACFSFFMQLHGSHTDSGAM